MTFTKLNLFCDIDNTVADQLSYNKNLFKEKGKIDSDIYEDKHLFNYKVIKGSKSSITNLSNFFKINWISARNIENEDCTLRWLEKYQFPIDNLFLVGQNDEKLEVLKNQNPYVFIDDMKYNYENLDPLPCVNFMNKLKKLEIQYEVFDNNWSYIETKYTKRNYNE